MTLIVGLGNPGTRYVGTRHNVGFLVVDRLEPEKIEGVKLFKPQLFMNKSGVAVRKYLKKFKVTNLKDLYVVHDDLDIKLGDYKITLGKGPKEHNGLKSIYEQVGDKNFWHVRVGIDGREGYELSRGVRNQKTSGTEYVLSKWKPEERIVIKEVVEKIVEELKNGLK